MKLVAGHAVTGALLEAAEPAKATAAPVLKGCPSAPAYRRVLVVAPQPFYEDRGTPIAVRQVVEGLSQLGYSVDLLTYPVGSGIQVPGVRLMRTANPLRFKSVPVGLFGEEGPAGHPAYRGAPVSPSHRCILLHSRRRRSGFPRRSVGSALQSAGDLRHAVQPSRAARRHLPG